MKNHLMALKYSFSSQNRNRNLSKIKSFFLNYSKFKLFKSDNN